MPITGSTYRAEMDIDRDGDVDSTDQTLRGVGGFVAALPKGALSTPGPGSGGGVDGTVGWSGYRYDQPTRLYAVRFRFYDAVTLRWLNRDPAGYVDSMNLHGYEIGSGIGWSDPFGLGGPSFATGAYVDRDGFIEYDPSQYSSRGLLWWMTRSRSNFVAGQWGQFLGFWQGLLHGWILNQDNLTFGLIPGLNTLADDIRANHARNSWYRGGDVAGKVGAFFAWWAAAEVALAFLPVYHYTTAEKALAIATEGVINAARYPTLLRVHGVWATVIPPALMARFPFLSFLIGKAPWEVRWAIRIYGAGRHWLWPWWRFVPGSVPLASVAVMVHVEGASVESPRSGDALRQYSGLGATCPH